MKFLKKNPIYIENDVLFYEAKDYMNAGVVSQWVYESVSTLSQIEQDLILCKMSNFSALFDFIFEHEDGFSKCLLFEKSMQKPEPKLLEKLEKTETTEEKPEQTDEDDQKELLITDLIESI